MSSSNFTTLSGHGKSFNRCMNGVADDAKIGKPAGRFDGGTAACEIETDRNFSGERNSEIGDDRAFAGG